ncbi:MAG TPA: hypothetical protein VFL62_13830 [Bradyrhizobium sp.]|uniref:DUF1835 domain-containing protein n=1 Tax=Bradyrhizobium sp. TaxID=376 RepID=UPI002D7EBE75|nr:hypothetical protein [Bradyrhizobium sp.]HET7887303.1 hypothetical protein [Bradyrhizobium sp.]
MADTLGSYPHFRLNFEQQGKRAKDLLKAAQAGEPQALARFRSPPKLAEAQYLIARELRFENWAALKRHIAGMTRAREAMHTSVLDRDFRTLHIRCGHDLETPLKEAGFSGDYYIDIYPYLSGPVREGPGSLEQRARHIVDCYGDQFDPPLEYEGQLRDLEDRERELHDSAAYEHVVLWFEHDVTDQLSLIHLLGHYATHRRPARLELVNIGDFPGTRRFTGLGELPPEALRMLWATRKSVSAAQLQLGLAAWRALASPDPRPLAAIMRGGTRALPLLARALHRHLRELPSLANGLSLTEQLALTLMAEPLPHWDGIVSLGRIYSTLHWETDPLPGQGDAQLRDRVLHMEGASAPLFERRAGVGPDGKARPPWTDRLEITALGRAVLKGDVDFMSLKPPPRWVGGVQIEAGMPDWRWDDKVKDAVRLGG